MSKNQKKTKKTYDPSLRWDVVEERAENLLARCAEHQASMNEIGCKSHRTFVLVEAV
jgi:hypothetical protein